MPIKPLIYEELAVALAERERLAQAALVQARAEVSAESAKLSELFGPLHRMLDEHRQCAAVLDKIKARRSFFDNLHLQLEGQMEAILGSASEDGGQFLYPLQNLFAAMPVPPGFARHAVRVADRLIAEKGERLEALAAEIAGYAKSNGLANPLG